MILYTYKISSRCSAVKELNIQVWYSTLKKKVSLWEPPIHISQVLVSVRWQFHLHPYAWGMQGVWHCRVTKHVHTKIKQKTWEKTSSVMSSFCVCVWGGGGGWWFFFFYLARFIRSACTRSGYRPLNLPSVDKQTSLTWTLFSSESTYLLTEWTGNYLNLNQSDCWIMHNHRVGLILWCPVTQQRTSIHL